MTRGKMKLKSGHYFCKLPDQEGFTIGPFITRKSAMNRMRRDYDLKRGAQFEIGKINLFYPQIDVDYVLDQFDCDAHDQGFDSGEFDFTRMTDETKKELDLLLNKAVRRWVKTQDLSFNFGLMYDVETVTL